MVKKRLSIDDVRARFEEIRGRVGSLKSEVTAAETDLAKVAAQIQRNGLRLDRIEGNLKKVSLRTKRVRRVLGVELVGALARVLLGNSDAKAIVDLASARTDYLTREPLPEFEIPDALIGLLADDIDRNLIKLNTERLTRIEAQRADLQAKHQELASSIAEARKEFEQLAAKVRRLNSALAATAEELALLGPSID